MYVLNNINTNTTSKRKETWLELAYSDKQELFFISVFKNLLNFEWQIFLRNKNDRKLSQYKRHDKKMCVFSFPVLDFFFIWMTKIFDLKYQLMKYIDLSVFTDLIYSLNDNLIICFNDNACKRDVLSI